MTAEVEVNPFRPGGELSKVAEDILKNSTISRDMVIINDPTLHRANGDANVTLDGSIVTKEEYKLSSKPPTSNGPNTPEPSPQSSPITCEVTAQHVPPLQSSPNFQSNQVEHVKIRSNKKKLNCCTVQ